MVGVEVACGATKLGGHLAGLQLLELLGEAIHKHHDLLAQACGRSRLTVGLGQHGHVFPLIGILLQLVDELFHLRIVHLFKRFLNGKGHAGVVDILRGEAEMDKLLVSLEPANLVELLLNEILHGLDVVVGNLLNILHVLCRLLVEGAVDVAQTIEKGMIERGELGQG